MSDGERADDYAGADLDFLRFLASESDKRVAAQLQVMLANDQRANGILAAAATLAAGGFAVAGTQTGKDGNPHLLAASIIFGIVASVAAIAAIWTLWPASVDIQGWSPRLFVGDLAKKKSPDLIAAEIAAHNQTKIAGNDRCNAELARRVKVAMIMLAASPAAGAVALWISAATGYVFG
jgi:hypothetical protein